MRYAMVAMAVIALVGLLVGALVAGRVLLPPNPRPPVLVDKTADPSASPPSDLVAYLVREPLLPGQGTCLEEGPSRICAVNNIYLANRDGSNAQFLPPAEEFGSRDLKGWSADGSRLLVTSIVVFGNTELQIIDLSGAVLQSFTHNELCPSPCAGIDGFSLSPDGARIAFIRSAPDADNSTVVAILDVASREVTELASTQTTNGSSDEQCWLSTQCEGFDDAPRWSPDGTRLVFARQDMSPEPGSSWTSAAVYVVNPDGSGLQRVTPEGWYAFDPHWNPDGSALAFVNEETIVNDDHTAVTSMLDDIYTIAPDGTGVEQLTDDGISGWPAWTADGHLTYARQVGSEDAPAFQDWIMRADGTDQTQLGTTLAELTDAGCVACIYPLDANGFVAFWQPRP